MIDDEPRVLDAMRRSLAGRYTLVTAASPVEGLAAVEGAVAEGFPFAVVVSDMMMPGMNGAQFLAEARRLSPDSIAMILSGQADLASTVEAVNGGNLFRFLLKPCDGPILTSAFDAALRQHQLVLGERELLAGTLNGAVAVLGEALAITNGEAFRRAGRLRSLVAAVAAALGVADDWELELAANLAQIGCVSLPGEVIEKVVTAQPLTPEEREMYRRHPAVARRLLERIPRLERVARWVGDQPVSVDDLPAPEPECLPSEIFATAAWMLTALDNGLRPTVALHRLLAAGRYSAPLLDALLVASTAAAPQGQHKEIPALDVRPGMTLLQDVLTTTGLVLVRKGERCTETLTTRLHNFARSVGVVEPVHVLVGGASDAPADE
jgi:CheY-like chemotaxis protein